ncbi:MAG TPA: hypothetical protein QGG59_09850 [Planctomycetota bacterium]|nr:hypothetical protein [Planctomycetota bacterium]
MMFVPILLSIFVCPQEDVGQRTDVLFIGDRGHHQPLKDLRMFGGHLLEKEFGWNGKKTFQKSVLSD